MKTLYIQLFLTFMSINAFTQNISADTDILRPIKTESAIIIDGKLNEPVWQKTIITNQLYNENGRYNNTESYFTYDADNLYAAFKCQVDDIVKLNTKKLDKDNELMLTNDWVAFCVDTYNDGINAYAFLVDAAGNGLDGALNPPTRDLSFSFSSKWTSAVKINQDAYTVEMKIPLENLPIRWHKDSVTMEIQIIRNDKQNNGMFQWPPTKDIGEYQTIVLHEIHRTHPENLSGVNIADRLTHKKSRIDVSTLLGRCQGGDASVMDYLIFKKRDINGAEHPRMLHHNMQTERVKGMFENTAYFKNLNTDLDFETMMERAQTTAFIVVQNDTILYENFFNGFNKDSIFTSFSVAKSFVSTLVGLAISDGVIKSEDDKITEYLPELMDKDVRFSQITIKDLLSMSAGIAYSGDGFPSDDDITYVSPDLRNATLDNVRIEEPPAIRWHYNNYHLLLLGLILEKTTGTTVSDYMDENLWRKMGAGAASWSLDENGFEKMESGINCNAYDYARFALLLLHKGKYNGVQVIPENWVQKATQPQEKPKGYYDSLLENNTYYNYLWWGKFRDGQENANDFFAMGNKGEYVYICPQKKLTIIRLGFEYGFTPGAFSWPNMFYEFATDFK
ncbi:serine hydrolase [Maribacter polysiphoniae]|uniref:serine hydrolase n=1 Tax=Maribacter polysiphoniae TaxID=429344 RepID=UPI002356D46D|nr:serine hydrolase [Maribacter polysiphoniae]